MKQKDELIQILNPRINRYIKINKTKGKIVSMKRTEGPYKNVTIINKSLRPYLYGMIKFP